MHCLVPTSCPRAFRCLPIRDCGGTARNKDHIALLALVQSCLFFARDSSHSVAASGTKQYCDGPQVLLSSQSLSSVSSITHDFSCHHISTGPPDTARRTPSTPTFDPSKKALRRYCHMLRETSTTQLILPSCPQLSHRTSELLTGESAEVSQTSHSLHLYAPFLHPSSPI